MKRILILFFLSIISSFSFGQAVLTVTGQTYTSTNTGYYGGYSVPRSVQTILTVSNNLFTTVNTSGYQLVAGDELTGANNNHLDGAVITGNRFIWNGTDPSNVSQTHALFTGYNVNVIIKYNYLYKSPNGIPRKSEGMHNTSGGIAYNLLIDPLVGVVAKGMNDVRIFNNTFYSTKSQAEIWRGLIDIHNNDDGGQNIPSTGTKIFNNIFYTEKERININIYEPECLEGFESDYNLYYCAESGSGPRFQIGSNIYTLAEWRLMGYDAHSVVIDPNFVDKIAFVPATRLDYGTDLGTEWLTGLATDAVWGFTDPATADQNGAWQVGARVFGPAGIPVTNITVTGQGGASAITTDNGTLQLAAAVLPNNATDNSVVWSIINGTGQATISASGVVTAVANGTVTARALAHDGSGISGNLVLTLSNQITPVTGITVTGAGGATTITTANGTLQLSAAVLPANATNNNVTWSLTNGTGQGTINTTGLVTALSSGTVTATATATDGSGIAGNLIITITNQPIHVTSISVTGAGGATSIATDNGTLQLTANVLPASATNKSVTWVITNGTGQANISTSGLVTAVSNGTVTARATANDGSGIFGTLLLNISNQTIPVSSINVTGAGGSTTIAVDNGTLQLSAAVLPADATNKNVTWTLTNGTGQATISGTGLVSAVANGLVTARATAVDGSGVSGTLILTVSNQIVPVAAITVTGTGGATVITTTNGTLQMIASVLPVNATNKTVAWTIENGTGQATISSGGLVTASAAGTVTAKATANDGSLIFGTLLLTITSQVTPVGSITVTGAGGATTITSENGTLQLSAMVLPADATNKTVTWTVENGTGEAIISASGVLTASSNGLVTARATANDGTGISGTLVISISNQIVPVSGITVTGEGGATAIFNDDGTLQLIASVLPIDATSKTVIWSVENGTGEAAINTSGLVTAVDNGTVTAKAESIDGSGVYGTLTITISGQIISVTNISVAGEGGVSSITTINSSLQLIAEILPSNATNKSVSWSVSNLTGAATISADGLVTALEYGTVTAQATANDGSGVYGTLNISINSNNQKPYSIIVTSDEVKIIFYEEFVSCMADLYNLQGSHIVRKIVDTDILVFNTAHLTPGLYFIVLSRGELLAVEKVMIP